MGEVVITGAKEMGRRRGGPTDGWEGVGGTKAPSWLRGGFVAATVVFALISLMAVGCRSSAPAPASEAAAPAAMPDDQMTEAAGEQQPAKVTDIEVREAAPGSVIELTADQPLVWTSYRNTAGDVVIELPNTVAPGISDVTSDDTIVRDVTVEEDRGGSRPLTRVVVLTHGDTEQNLRADGNHLFVELTPVDGEPEPALAFEPIAEEEVGAENAPTPVLEPAPNHAEAAEPAGAEAQMAQAPMAHTTHTARTETMETTAPARDLGTPDSPVEGPAPQGVQATRLRQVQVHRTDDMTVVEIAGDGEFAYSTFRLGEPERFVVDLAGVVNQSDRAAIPVGSDAVERVRVAQFKPFPDPVSRVVFDLNDHPSPDIERTPESLIIRFPTGGAPVAAARMEPQTPPPAAPATHRAAPPEPAQPVGPAAAAPMEMESEPSSMASAPAEMTMTGGGDEGVRITNAPPSEPSPEPSMASDHGMDSMEPPSQAAMPSAATSDAGLFGTKNVGEEAAGDQGDGDGPVFGARTVSNEREYFGEPIDMTLKDADVVETLRSFSKIAGLNIVIQPGVTGRVTVELHDVPWDQALEQILKINGLGYEVDGNIMRIATLKTLSDEAQQQQVLEQAKSLSRPLQTIMKRLSYTSARNVAQILRSGGRQSILSPRGSVIVDQRTNTLILSELPEYMDTVLAIVDNLDEPEPQVMIEARIIETTKRFSRTLGVNWGFDLTAGPGTGNSTGVQFPNNVDASGSVNLATGGQNGLLNLRFGNILNTFQLDAVLNAAEEDGLVNILSTPKVATLNNHQATIQSGVQVPIQTVANNTVTVQFVNATLRLEVTPQITADGTVVMDIRIQKREVQTAFLLPGAQNAPISTKEATTQVLVRDGGTAVIGGIYEVSTDQSENRVPGLANIPILGHLFRNRDRSDQNQELLIFITPRVVRL